jgi:hypothetical protein
MQEELLVLIPRIANFVAIAFLIRYGLRLFGEYHSKGRWAKNATSLFAGAGLLGLALTLLVTPQNTAVLLLIARTKVPYVLLWISNLLLLAAIAAFGFITYARPLRLWYERKVARDLQQTRPKIL